ncbi:DUF1801 domain-containing protein [Daejeonella sp.]|uniref:DUF1801 domain-containing protein n=1 Tax=Daejeonella sp. TaxID=2805397 RepID=UPI0030BE7E10
MKEKTLESYYLSKSEPFQSCLLALRQLILSVDPLITTERKFQIPFFQYKGKKLGYLWLNGKKLMIGFCLDKSVQKTVEGVKPKDIYESFRIDPNADLPIEVIRSKVETLLKKIDDK